MNFENTNESFLNKSDQRIVFCSPKEWNKSHLKNQLKKIQEKKILVVGDVGVDRYITGKVERISPEAPVPIVWVESEKLKLGLAANISDNVKALGGKSHLVGVMGADRGAEDLKYLLQQQNISDQFLVTDATRKTIIKERIVSQNQQLMRIDYESPGRVSIQTQSALFNEIKKAIQDVDMIVLEDYAKGMVSKEFCQELVKLSQESNVRILADPHRHSSLQFYEGVQLIKPNKKEAEVLTKMEIVDNESLLRSGRILIEKTNAEHAFITLGKDGMAVFSKKDFEKAFIVPTCAREVYDVSGAGDTVISVLALMLAANVSIEDAAIIANIAGGIVVGKFGTATTTVQEIEKEIDRIS